MNRQTNIYTHVCNAHHYLYTILTPVTRCRSDFCVPSVLDVEITDDSIVCLIGARLTLA